MKSHGVTYELKGNILSVNISANASGFDPKPSTILICELISKEGGHQLVWKPTGKKTEYLQHLIIPIIDQKRNKKYLCGMKQKPFYNNINLSFDDKKKTFLTQQISFKYPWPKSLKIVQGDKPFYITEKRTLEANDLCKLKFDEYADFIQVSAELIDQTHTKEIARMIGLWKGLTKDKTDLEETNLALQTLSDQVGEYVNSLSNEEQETYKSILPRNSHNELVWKRVINNEDDKVAKKKLQKWFDGAKRIPMRREYLTKRINNKKNNMSMDIERLKFYRK